MKIAPLAVVPENPLRKDGGGSSDADATQEEKAWAGRQTSFKKKFTASRHRDSGHPKACFS